VGEGVNDMVYSRSSAHMHFQAMQRRSRNHKLILNPNDLVIFDGLKGKTLHAYTQVGQHENIRSCVIERADTYIVKDSAATMRAVMTLAALTFTTSARTIRASSKAKF